MTDDVTETEAFARVTRLTRTRLTAYIEADVIRPRLGDDGLRFRQSDLARLELLCDLTEHFDLEGDALGVVLALIDQLHATRRDLASLAAALSTEAEEVRDRVGRALFAARSGGR